VVSLRLGSLEGLRSQLLEVTLALVVGFVGGALALTAFGYNAFENIQVMISYGFRDLSYLLLKSAPIVLTALAFLVPLKAGLFNIGGEGQLYAGAITALLLSKVGFYLAIPAGALAGLLVGVAIGLLRVVRGVNEVVSSIMFNWTLYYLSMFAIQRYLLDPVYTHQSIRVDRVLSLPEVAAVMLLSPLAVYLLLYNTELGYRIRVAGSSSRVARYAGVNLNIVTIQSMAIGGFLAGLGGAIQVYGVTTVVDTTLSSLYGLGFLGIGVALIARGNPLAVIPAAILVSGLLIGSHWMELRGRVAPELADVVIGVVIIALSAPYAYRVLASRMGWGVGGG
jgi:simple sugar transport system permease protein